jgi:hypothetical protein
MNNNEHIRLERDLQIEILERQLLWEVAQSTLHPTIFGRYENRRQQIHQEALRNMT